METVIQKEKATVKLKEDSIGVYITREALTKMFLYAREAEGEISGLGLVESKAGIYYIKDVKIFKQECTGADTEIDNAELSKFFEELILRGEDTTKWRLWWHSHAGMNTYFSATDETCASELLENFEDYLIGIVVNKKGELYCRFQCVTPFEITIENVPLRVLDLENKELEAAIKAEVKELVSTPVAQGTYNKNAADLASTGIYHPRGWAKRTPGIVEPQVTGSWDKGCKVHRNIHDKRVWNTVQKAWMFDPTKMETECEICEHKSKKFSYHESSDRWVCKLCKRILDSKNEDWQTMEEMQADYDAAEAKGARRYIGYDG